MSRSAISTGIPAAIRSASTAWPCAPVPASSTTSLVGSTPGPSSTPSPGTRRQPPPGGGDHAQQAARTTGAVAGQQRACGVDAGEDRACRAGGVGGLERPVQPGRVEQLRSGRAPARPGCRRAVPCARWSPSRPRRPRCACGGRSGWKPRWAAQAASTMSGTPASCAARAWPGEVAGGAHVGGVAEEHRARLAGGSRGPPGRSPPRPRREGRSPGHARAAPTPAAARPGPARAAATGAGSGDDDLLPGRADGQRQRLVAVGRPGHREPAPVGAPQPRRPLLRVGQQGVRVLDRVEPAVQRHVAGHHRAGQVLALLVTGDAHRGERAGLRLLGEPQPGIQQRSAGTQPPRVARVAGVRGPRRAVVPVAPVVPASPAVIAPLPLPRPPAGQPRAWPEGCAGSLPCR